MKLKPNAVKFLIAITAGLLSWGGAMFSLQGVYAAGPVLTRYPFIAKQTATATIIIWHTDVATTSQLDYGPTLSYGSTLFNTTPVTRHVFTLTNLMANTQYYYRAVVGGIPLADGSSYYFETEKSPTFTFVALGDTGIGQVEQKNLAARIRTISPNLVIVTGDLFYSGYSCSVASNYQCAFYDVYSPTLRNIPFYVTPGDHDYDDLTNNQYMTTFVHLYTSTSLAQAFYAVEYNNALFITINTDVSNPSYFSVGSSTYNWLEQQLRDSSKFWKIVFFDKPPYASGMKRSGARYDGDIRLALSPLFERYNVDLVFNGDYHLYERSWPIHEYFPGNRGVIYIITGGGGSTDLIDAGQDWWTAYSRKTYHLVRVDVNDCRLTLQAIDNAGITFDTYTIDRCSP